MATSAIRFTGLASGMDTESLVKAMVAPYQAKVDAKLQQQTLLEWKKDAYKEMNAKVYSFFTKYASPSRLTSTFSQKNITSSDTDKVQVESGGVAPEGTHTINSITRLAEAARVQTSVIALN
jgi:flagellar hook-associated protein 2